MGEVHLELGVAGPLDPARLAAAVGSAMAAHPMPGRPGTNRRSRGSRKRRRSPGVLETRRPASQMPFKHKRQPLPTARRRSRLRPSARPSDRPETCPGSGPCQLHREAQPIAASPPTDDRRRQPDPAAGQPTASSLSTTAGDDPKTVNALRPSSKASRTPSRNVPPERDPIARWWRGGPQQLIWWAPRRVGVLGVVEQGGGGVVGVALPGAVLCWCARCLRILCLGSTGSCRPSTERFVRCEPPRPLAPTGGG